MEERLQEEPPKEKSNPSKYFPVYYIPIILLVVGLLAWKRFVPQPLRVYGQVPRFQLTAENGKSFDSQSLSGKVWLADFFYSTCHTSCPIQTADMSNIQKEYNNQKNFDLVSFTLDPEHDTPRVLTDYARNTQANEKQWFFLTGPKSKIYDLAWNTFQVTAHPDPNSPVPAFIHSTRLILVDQQGRIRGYYNVLEPTELKQLDLDLKKLLG